MDGPVVTHGCSDFHGRRLHVLQIGLGTFATFVQNVAETDQRYAAIDWLLLAASNKSPQLRAVGVEPVSEHVDRLVPHLTSLPNVALVKAAVSNRNGRDHVFCMSSSADGVRQEAVWDPKSSPKHTQGPQEAPWCLDKHQEARMRVS